MRMTFGSHLLRALIEQHLLLRIVQLPEASGFAMTFLRVASKKEIFPASIKSVRSIAETIYNEFSERARTAEANQGADWKAKQTAMRAEIPKVFNRPAASLGDYVAPRQSDSTDPRTLLTVDQPKATLFLVDLCPFQIDDFTPTATSQSLEPDDCHRSFKAIFGLSLFENQTEQ